MFKRREKNVSNGVYIGINQVYFIYVTFMHLYMYVILQCTAHSVKAHRNGSSCRYRIQSGNIGSFIHSFFFLIIIIGVEVVSMFKSNFFSFLLLHCFCYISLWFSIPQPQHVCIYVLCTTRIMCSIQSFARCTRHTTHINVRVHAWCIYLYNNNKNR